jgi:hypothetical protein
MAQFEREMMLERQREGIAKAKAQGKYSARATLRGWAALIAARSSRRTAAGAYRIPRGDPVLWRALQGASCHPLGGHGHRSQCRRRGDSDLDVGLSLDQT